MQHSTVGEGDFIIEADTSPEEIAKLQAQRKRFNIYIRRQSNLEAIKALPGDNKWLDEIIIDELLDTVQLNAIPDEAINNVVVAYRRLSEEDSAEMKNILQPRLNSVNTRPAASALLVNSPVIVTNQAPLNSAVVFAKPAPISREKCEEKKQMQDPKKLGRM